MGVGMAWQKEELFINAFAITFFISKIPVQIMKPSGPKFLLLAIGFLLLAACSYGQGSPGHQPTDQKVRTACSGFQLSISVPVIDAYERIRTQCLEHRAINIHYYSDFVATVDLVLQKAKKGLMIRGILFYSPCQTCENGQTETYVLLVNKPLSDFKAVDIIDYVMKNGKRSIYYKTDYNRLFRTFTKKALQLSR